MSRSPQTDDAPASTAPAARGGASSHHDPPDAWRDRVGDFVRRVWKKAEQDQIFFMAGAIAFNIVVAIVPLILAALGVAGLILQSRYGLSAEEPLLDYTLEALPPVSTEFTEQMRELIRGLLDQSSGFLGIGTLIFAWLSTRLIGTLRTALREIFDIQQDRGIVSGKIFDIKMVFAAGTLLAVNAALTVLFDVFARIGFDFIGMRPVGWSTFLLRGGAFLSIFVMFLLIYRYLPARRIQWRTALVAATFTAVGVEMLKFGFSWYVGNLAGYRTTYNNLANLFVVVLWIYYSAVIFILGGEVAQVTALQRIRRQQKERLG